MADRRPNDFPSLLVGQLTNDTELYTQSPGGGTANSDYKFTLGQLKTALNLLSVASGGPYVDDAAADAGGVAIGEYYELAINNNYGIAVGNGGITKKRVS